MGGCENCGAKKGCTHRKQAMFTELERTLATLYPTRTWGKPDDLARFGAGIDAHEGQVLAEELARELDAATFFRSGSSEEYCDYIYVLCLGREPCLVQIRDGGVPIPAEFNNEPNSTSGSPHKQPSLAPPVREMYLRVCLSHMARMAGVQQVSMTLDISDGDAFIHEHTRSGVYDAPLLRRMQRLVAILPAYDITHLDFGEISAPPEGFAPGRYADLYTGLPHTANYLFFPQPSTMNITIAVPDDHSRQV